MEKIIIERLGRRKEVVERWILDEFPVMIGRGYGNDVIVSDPYVAERQLSVTRASHGWQIENLDGLNDLLLNDHIQKEPSFEICSGNTLVIGETPLRIVSSTYNVIATKKLVKEKDYLTNAQRIVIAWASVIFALGCFFLIEFLDTARDTSAVQILARALPSIAIPLSWTVLWASIGRTLAFTPKFHKHLFVSTIIVLAGRCSLILREYVTYMLNSESVGKAFFYVVAGVLAVFLLTINLKLATSFSRIQRLGIAHAVVWGAVILFEFFMFARQPEFRKRTNFNSTIKPPYAQILPGKSVDEFFADTDTLFQKVDQMVEKEKK